MGPPPPPPPPPPSLRSEMPGKGGGNGARPRPEMGAPRTARLCFHARAAGRGRGARHCERLPRGRADTGRR
jgi:hypothetical protein